jgi:hypothetical protein
MTTDRFQCPFCGYLLASDTEVCPVCHPYREVPEHVKKEWAVAHLRALILYFAKDDAVVREASLWKEHPFLEEEVRPLLLRMEEDGEIERFAGHYRTRDGDTPHPE